MTKKTKLIVGAVVVLGAFYLYTKNKAKSEVADLKAGADVTPRPEPSPTPSEETIKPLASTSIPIVATELRADSIQVAEAGNKFSNFAGRKGNSYFDTIF
jgi:hypothetical protein